MSAPTVNVCFHGIGAPDRELEAGEADYWISADLFHDVLDVVAGDPRVRLSFDDGNASDMTLGLPALAERGLHATFFVLAGRLDAPGSLAEDDVHALCAAGMTIGSHGMDHVPWRGLPADALRRELVESRLRLEELVGATVDQAALPLGRYDRRLLRQVRRLGYRHLHTSDRRWARPDAWLQPRFSVRRGDTVASLRRDVLAPAPLARRARTRAIGVVKSLR